MSEVVVFSNDALMFFLIFGILGLVGTFLLKLYNILNGCEFYDIKMSVVTLAIGTISFMLILISVLITFSKAVESTYIEYNIYMWFSRIFIVMLWIFFFGEILIYAGKSTQDILTRMSKRRNERINNYR